ncbi:hypothetical protein [Acinetobacter guillouiae]
MKAFNKKIMFSVFSGLVMSLSHAAEVETSNTVNTRTSTDTKILA